MSENVENNLINNESKEKTELDSLTEQINIDKEILETLPKNTERNLKLYTDKVKEIEEKYQVYKDKYFKEIQRRYNKLSNIEYNEVKIQSDELKNLESILYLLNELDSSYEKMDLDKEIHNLTYYYKKNLQLVNEAIITCIKKFEEVGVEVELRDFNYNKYVQEYFEVFFIAMQRNDVNSQVIKDKFEELYWKCPEIITYIELNLRYIYMKNEKKIDKYYDDQKQKLLKKFSSEELRNRYATLKASVCEKEKENPKEIIDKFLSGELKTRDYSKSTIISMISRYITTEDITDNQLNDINLTMIKLYNSVYEYKNYFKFKYIIDDVVNAYKEKDKYKNSYVQLKKQIQKNEKNILRLNGSWFARSSFAKQTKLALETKELYKKLDNEKVYSTIATKLNDDSSLYDIVYLASSFYDYLCECIKKNNDGISEDDISNTIDEFCDFAKWPYFTILNNIKITEDKDMLFIIKDRYQLLNINITKDDLSVDNLDNLMGILTKCEKYYYINMNNINLENIQAEIELKKIIDENN